MAGRGIGYNELSESLKNMIQANITDGAVGFIIKEIPEFVYNVVYTDEEIVIKHIVFVDDVNIKEYDPESEDLLIVYKNGLRMTEGIDYIINDDNRSIDILKDGWTAPKYEELVVSFVLKQNESVAMNITIADKDDIRSLFLNKEE